jgi:phosphate transport system permease protein
MNSSILFFVLLCLTLFSYWFGVQRSLKVAGGAGHKKDLTSLPQQFGLLTAMVCGLPALITLLIFNSGEHIVVEQLLISTMPVNIQSLSNVDIGLYLNNIRSIAGSETAANILQLLSQSSDLKTQTEYKAAFTLQELNQQAA